MAECLNLLRGLYWLRLRLRRGRSLLLGLRRLWFRLLGARSQDRVQGIAFLPRPKLHNSLVANVFSKALQNSTSQACAGHLASAEEDGRLDLVSFIEKTQHVVLFGFVVVVVHINAELYFF